MIYLASHYTHLVMAPSAGHREEDKSGAQAKTVHSWATSNEDAHLAILIKIPVLRVERDDVAVTRIEIEYLPFNGCKILDVLFREHREVDFRNLGVHMVNIVAEAFPNSIECLCAFFGDGLLLDKKINNLRTIHFVAGFDVIAFDDEFPDSLGDSLGHHDNTEEVPIRVKADALSRSLSEMMVWNDVLVRNFKVAVDTLMKRCIEAGEQSIADHTAYDLFWNASHDTYSFRSFGAVVSTRVRVI